MGDGVCSPDYLAEFVRAQNYPHLKIHINFSRGTKSDSVGGKAGRTPSDRPVDGQGHEPTFTDRSTECSSGLTSQPNQYDNNRANDNPAPHTQIIAESRPQICEPCHPRLRSRDSLT
jgi:hypothetical protein